jgi:invasion protein IalB
MVRRTALLLTGALAAVAIAAFYVVLGTPPPAEMLAIVQGKQRIAPGFIGVAKFGEWRLICVPGPPSFDGLGPTLSSEEQGARKTPAGNACRINQEMPAPEQNRAAGESSAQAARRVIIAANFSLVGPKHMPAAMLRLPATARPGDVIILRFEDQTVVNTTVRDCSATECLAAATLSPSDWAHLSGAKSLQVAFPALGRQWVLLNLPVDGLTAAIDALDRAATPSH